MYCSCCRCARRSTATDRSDTEPRRERRWRPSGVCRRSRSPYPCGRHLPWIERSVIAEGRIAQEVLQIWVLPDLLDRLFIAYLQVLLYDQAADRDARDQRRRTGGGPKPRGVPALDAIPGNQLRQAYSAVAAAEAPPKRQVKGFEFSLLILLFPVHHCLPRRSPSARVFCRNRPFSCSHWDDSATYLIVEYTLVGCLESLNYEYK